MSNPTMIFLCKGDLEDFLKDDDPRKCATSDCPEDFIKGEPKKEKDVKHNDDTSNFIIIWFFQIKA